MLELGVGLAQAPVRDVLGLRSSLAQERGGRVSHLSGCWCSAARRGSWDSWVVSQVLGTNLWALAAPPPPKGPSRLLSCGASEVGERRKVRRE